MWLLKLGHKKDAALAWLSGHLPLELSFYAMWKLKPAHMERLVKGELSVSGDSQH